MVEVIDFNDLSTHLVDKHDPSLLGNPTKEQAASEKKKANELLILLIITCVVCFVVYISFFHDKSAIGTEAGAYQSENTPIFESIKHEFAGLKDITCNEGTRIDCVSYTLTFRPESQDGVSKGATSADVTRLGGYFNVILQSKLKHLASRKDGLTFKVVSINNTASYNEEKVTYTCVEYYGQIKCDN